MCSSNCFVGFAGFWLFDYPVAPTREPFLAAAALVAVSLGHGSNWGNEKKTRCDMLRLGGRWKCRCKRFRLGRRASSSQGTRMSKVHFGVASPHGRVEAMESDRGPRRKTTTNKPETLRSKREA